MSVMLPPRTGDLPAGFDPTFSATPTNIVAFSSASSLTPFVRPLTPSTSGHHMEGSARVQLSLEVDVSGAVSGHSFRLPPTRPKESNDGTMIAQAASIVTAGPSSGGKSTSRINIAHCPQLVQPLTDPSNNYNTPSAHAPPHTRNNAEAGPSRPTRIKIFKGTYALAPLSVSPKSSTFSLGQSRFDGQHYGDGYTRSTPSVLTISSSSSSEFTIDPPDMHSRDTQARKDGTSGMVVGGSSVVPGLSEKEFEGWQKDGLRPLRCSWGACDAVLASWDLLAKHTRLHLKRDQLGLAVKIAKEARPGKLTPPPRYSCRFRRCGAALESFQLLERHVCGDGGHMDKTFLVGSSWCPLDDCSHKVSRSCQEHLQRHHPEQTTFQLQGHLTSASSPLVTPGVVSLRIKSPTSQLPQMYPAFLIHQPAVLAGRKMDFNKLSHELAAHAEAKGHSSSKEFRVAFGMLPQGNLKDLVGFRDSPEMWGDNFLSSGSIGEHMTVRLKAYRSMPCTTKAITGLVVRKRTWQPSPDEVIKRRKLGDGSGKALPSIGLEVYQRKISSF